MGNKRTVMFSPDTDPTVTERTMHLREQPLSPAAVLVLHKEVRPVNHNLQILGSCTQAYGGVFLSSVAVSCIFGACIEMHY